MMWLAALSVAVLLLASALLTASYEAVSQISQSHLRTLGEEGFEGAAALAALREDKHATRTTVRVLTVMIDLSAIGLVSLTRASTWGAAGPVTSTVIGIVVVLVLGELVPQMVATRRPVRLALSSAPALLRLTRLARPVTVSLARLDDVGPGEEQKSDERRELREIQEIGEEEGVIEASESLLVERAFRLDELTAWDVMIPRVDILAWKEERTVAEIVAELTEVPYSRVPVYRESVDDVTGIVYVREIYEKFAQGVRDVPIAELAREPFFVPGSLPLTTLLQDFQARRIHLGIVADEFGGTDGLVTLEDILEELVGEIRDETDVEEEEIVRVADDSVECDAGVDLRDLDDALGISLPKVEHRSVNGFILEELGHVPKTGETFESAGVRFEILEATETQVLRARVTRMPSAEGEA